VASAGEALKLAVRAGEILLASGAEIQRVQETVIRILESYGVRDYHVYILANGILASAEDDEFHVLRHIPEQHIDFRRIDRVNTVSRSIARAGGGDLAQWYRELAECAAIDPYPWWLLLLAGGGGGATFCYLLGGSPADSVSALLAALVMQAFLLAGDRLRLNQYIKTILAAGIGSLFCQIFFLCGVGSSSHAAITGVIIPLVPGVAFTTAIRDFFVRDYLSGTIHIVDAVLTAASIAVGVGCLLYLWNMLPWGTL
jgi:uncharacterized membrane protein YjjP (DUF1212 family)